ncbi:efflux RND transporter permease subunit [Mesorhizobium newzealandense]|uniref:Efflux RND transporter permease subunit n=1 Tax=Mesorhizobium newzealandense TaxID=1300302 RepID=A0ABW4UCJ3_9HYPH
MLRSLADAQRRDVPLLRSLEEPADRRGQRLSRLPSAFGKARAAGEACVSMVNFFIHRPIFASAIAIIMVLAGTEFVISCCLSRSFPTSHHRRSVVSAHYPGASAQVVADTVTTPLEQQINGVQGHDLHVVDE